MASTKSKPALPAKGAKVAWQTSQGETTGTVEKIVTRRTTIKGHTATPTEQQPEVLVRSAKSGKQAVHKPAALKRV